ncbi:MAG TPA: YidC/Oxa1 family membrane protein insertase [Streptosporangiaceae bacterium]|nr:YidC/Oxa1 family membrane protein insertase [Streptosporangiaceae bacterium]
MLGFLDAGVSVAYHVVTNLVQLLAPLGGGLAAVAAIIAFTVAIRLILLPLSYYALRGQAGQARLQPELAELRRRYGHQPDRLQREIGALYQREGGTLLIGCLPLLVQLPFFSIMYRLFLSPTVAGHANQLLAHTVAGVPLSAHVFGLSWLDHGSVGQVLGVTGLFSVHGLVFVGLIALLALVGWASVRLAQRVTQAAAVLTPAAPARPAARKAGSVQPAVRKAGPGGRTAQAPAVTADTQGRAVAALTKVIPYFTAVIALFVPLAAGIYLLTTTAWTLAERAALRRRAQEAADRSAAARARTAVS